MKEKWFSPKEKLASTQVKARFNSKENWIPLKRLPNKKKVASTERKVGFYSKKGGLHRKKEWERNGSF